MLFSFLLVVLLARFPQMCRELRAGMLSTPVIFLILQLGKIVVARPGFRSYIGNNLAQLFQEHLLLLL